MSVQHLPSWNDGPAKRAIVEFVESVSQPGPEFVSVADRIATFDNDGTLWVERPAPPQFDFLIRAWTKAATDDPSLVTQQPYKAIIEHDKGFFDDLAEQDPTALAALESAAGRTWSGTTPDVFDAEVREWIATVKQPRFGVGYTSLVYRPMLELFDFLRAHQFRVMVCSGGGRDFMRVFAEDLWGIFNENVIGTSAEYEYRDGKIVRTDRMFGGLALGPGKPEHIFSRTGRLPIFAGGNADVDIEMLECAKFALLLNHDDADREYDYVNGAEKSLAAASELGWTVVSMKNDWASVFAAGIGEVSASGS
jgi:phosphoserine phosphatase